MTGRRKKSTRAVRPASIKDVARLAKVSVATVSRTLAMPDVVAGSTRRQVEVAVRRLQYAPNLQAQGLRTARTRVVVAIVPDISNPFFSEVIRGIEQVAHENRYSVLLGDTQGNREREQAYADLVAARRADGVITLSPHLPRIPRLHGRLPIVNACELAADATVSAVSVDNAGGAEEAMRHLLELGHRNIAFMAGPVASPISIDREQGYLRALREAGIEPSRRLSVAGDFSLESGIAGMETLFSRNERFTALFCSNDEMAFGAIRAIRAKGLKVPEDISVVGFDDIRFAQYWEPSLTTVMQPMGEIGREAMQMLVGILETSSGEIHRRVLPTRLVVRESTGKCAFI